MRRARLHAGIALQAQAAGNDPLEIRKIRAFPLREPGSGRRYTLVKIETRGGLAGWGECGEFTRAEFAAARDAVVGTMASAYEIAWRKLGQARAIRAAVNMAQLDVLGKLSKAPVYQVLGGPTRFKARAIARLEGPAALDRAQTAGYKAFLVPAVPTEWRNQGKAYMNRIRNLMNMMRNAAGADSDFVLDAAGAFTPGDAQSVAAELESFHMLWFDEPCGVLNLGAIRKIAGENVTPLGFGRTVGDAQGFQNLLLEDAVDLLRPDLAVHGISQIRRIAAIAEVYYVAVAPYHNGGPVATAAALHLAASLPNFFIQQVPLPGAQSDIDMRRAIAGDAIEKVTGGFLALPTGPGFGITVNEQALTRYQEAA